ncbi:MAG: hypothetical protein AB7U73_19855 [Pirellulales bacterium]
MNRIRLNRPIVVQTIETRPGEAPIERQLNPAADPLIKLVVDRVIDKLPEEARRHAAVTADWPNDAYHDRASRVRNDLAPPFEGTHSVEPATSDEWIRREGRDSGSQAAH